MDSTSPSRPADEALSHIAMALTENSRQELIEVPTATETLDVKPNDCDPTPEPTPASTLVEEPPVLSATPALSHTDLPPTMIVCEENGMVYFGDNYLELPKGSYIDKQIIPDTIILHTDAQPRDFPEKWNTMTTYWGLEGEKSVHFAVSQDGILQMLPMYETTVMHCIGTTPFFNDEERIVDYNQRSIQIEMGGRNYNDIVTGDASPEMASAIEITTQKTIDLVITLMGFYNIPIGHIFGHYQINTGNTDPARLYFEEYFMPRLVEALSEKNPNAEGSID
jgi:hypothetical protein